MTDGRVLEHYGVSRAAEWQRRNGTSGTANHRLVRTRCCAPHNLVVHPPRPVLIGLACHKQQTTPATTPAPTWSPTVPGFFLLPS